MASPADSEPPFYEIKASSGCHSRRSQHRRLNFREQVFFEYSRHVDRRCIYVDTAAAFFAPVDEVRLIAADDELEIELQALSSPRNVFEFCRCILTTPSIVVRRSMALFSAMYASPDAVGVRLPSRSA